MGSYVNPLSKTLIRTEPNRINTPSEPANITIAEVVEVLTSGPQAGYIKYRHTKTVNESVESVTNLAQPLLANVKIYPLAGEFVMLVTLGNVYYLPLNLFNNPVNNIGAPILNSTLSDQSSDISKISGKNKTFSSSDKIHIVTAHQEGDVILEGRFGQSIKFGSTVKYNDQSKNSWSTSDLSDNGDPILIIRNGIKNPYENITEDLTSIYLCSTQKLRIDNGNNGFEGITAPWSTINISGDSITISEDPYKLTAAELKLLKEARTQAQQDEAIQAAAGNVEGAKAAREKEEYINRQVQTEEVAAVPYEGPPPPIISETSTEICKKIIRAAQMDLGVVESPANSNSGPRVNQMLQLTGLPPGNYWCAAAVTAWFKAAGADLPPSGKASCDVWMRWAQSKGSFSKVPVPGAAILYGTLADAHHIGIVESVSSDYPANGSLVSIEGNTSSTKFDRNGGGVYRKKPNLSSTTWPIVGYILPTVNGKASPCTQIKK